MTSRPARPVQPVSPDVLVKQLAHRIAAAPGLVRVGIDGPACSAPEDVAEGLLDPLRAAGRQAVHVRAEQFWHDASVRLEYGREDPDAYLDWLDGRSLRREVLDAAAERHTYLPSLRDPATNRATHEQPGELDADAVVVVSGTFLLGLGLPFELVVHLALSAAARARRTSAAQAWTLAAHDRYDAEIGPADLAEIVVRWDDPRRPAVIGLT